MDVPAFDAESVEVFGQLLGHAFGEGGDEHAFVFCQGLADFDHEVVDLVVARSHIDGRVQQAGGSNDLFHHDPFRTLKLKIRRGGTHVDGLVDNAVKLVMRQGAVVEGRGQSEPVVDEGDLSRAVAPEHGANLRHRHMALVNDDEEVFGEIVEEAKGTFSRLPAVEIPRVVLNPGAEPNFLDHFQVIQRPLVQALGLQKAGLLVEKALLFFQILLNLPNRRVGRLLATHEQVGRVDADLLEDVQLRPTLWIDGGDAFNLVVPKFNPHRVVGVRQMDVDGVSFHTKIAPLEVAHCAAVQAGDEAVEEVVAGDALTDLEADHVLVEFHGVADAVDAADARHHDDITAPTQQGRGGGQPEFFNLVVDLQVLLDVGV